MIPASSLGNSHCLLLCCSAAGRKAYRNTNTSTGRQTDRQAGRLFVWSSTALYRFHLMVWWSWQRIKQNLRETGRQTGRYTGGLHTFGVSFDGAGQTEELDQPTVIQYQRLNEPTGQDLQTDSEIDRQTNTKRERATEKVWQQQFL